MFRHMNGKAISASLGMLALLGTYGCQSSSDIATVRAQQMEAGLARQVGYSGAPVISSYDRQSASSFSQQPAGMNGPVLVTCEAGQRTLVRSVLLNGQAVSQVECVSTGMMPAQMQYEQEPIVTYAAAPVRAVPVATTYRAVAPQRRVAYEPARPVSTGRTKTKSAIIIGSSAGVGAGVGAAVGGKKGALIGAAIGGGGAAIWDQMTRKR